MTDNTQDRIRIYEAMGWQWSMVDDHWGEWVRPDGSSCRRPRGMRCSALPDPFTSADDDYAVLCWVRHGNNSAEQYRLFKNAFESDYIDGIARWYLYEVGDYARAFLKTLEDV